MQEHEYNWNLILKISAPFSLIVAYIHYSDFSRFTRWFSLIVGMILTGAVIYTKDKKKGDIYTGMTLVALVAVLVTALKRMGIL